MVPGVPVSGCIWIIASLARIAGWWSVGSPTILVILASSFYGTFVVRIPANPASRVCAKSLPMLLVTASTSSG